MNIRANNQVLKNRRTYGKSIMPVVLGSPTGYRKEIVYDFEETNQIVSRWLESLQPLKLPNAICAIWGMQ